MDYTNPLRTGYRGTSGVRGSSAQARAVVGNGHLYAQVLNLARIDAASKKRGLTADEGRGIMLRELKRINEDLAKELQQLIADNLDQARVPSRRQVSSGRLEAAILDERNRTVTPFTFGVGVKKFLDSSGAKYWRSIEVGTNQFVGNEIKAGWLWGTSLTGQMGGRSQYGPYPIAGPSFSLTSSTSARNGRILPMNKRTAYRTLAANGMSKRDAFLATRQLSAVTIEKPILPHWMFRDGWRDFDGVAKGKKALTEALYYMGLTGPQ